MKKIGKGVLLVLVIAATLLIAGLAGQLDQDEYIEAHLTPKARFIN